MWLSLALLDLYGLALRAAELARLAVTVWWDPCRVAAGPLPCGLSLREPRGRPQRALARILRQLPCASLYVWRAELIGARAYADPLEFCLRAPQGIVQCSLSFERRQLCLSARGAERRLGSDALDALGARLLADEAAELFRQAPPAAP